MSTAQSLKDRVRDEVPPWTSAERGPLPAAILSTAAGDTRRHVCTVYPQCAHKVVLPSRAALDAGQRETQTPVFSYVRPGFIHVGSLDANILISAILFKAGQQAPNGVPRAKATSANWDWTISESLSQTWDPAAARLASHGQHRCGVCRRALPLKESDLGDHPPCRPLTPAPAPAACGSLSLCRSHMFPSAGREAADSRIVE